MGNSSGDYELLSDHPETEVTSQVYRGQLKDGTQVRENPFTIALQLFMLWSL